MGRSLNRIRYDILQILHPKKGTKCWKMLEFPKGLIGYENLTKLVFYFIYSRYENLTKPQFYF